MVNGEDYNNFPYTLYSSIIKSKALNRGSIGVSRSFDLLDPTGKYSSMNSFADDGGLYQNSAQDAVSFSFNNDNDIYTFLSETVRADIAGHRSQQYYCQNYTRYPVGTTSGDGIVKWKQVGFNNTNVTGYFYNSLAVPVGQYSSGNLRYVSPGALVKFQAPAGYYFDSNNRLVYGIPGPSDTATVWTSVTSVIGDGYNGGEGVMINGAGPITLAGNIPTTALIVEIIPVFDNVLSSTVIQECVNRMNLNQSFCLRYNNSLIATQERWSVGTYSATDWFIRFTSDGNNRYIVSTRALAYYFGSVRDTRFVFDSNKVVYDPLSGKLFRDNIVVLRTNTKPDSTNALAREIVLDVVGQNVEADGYVDDFAIEVSSADTNNSNIIRDPDFFKTITGYTTGITNSRYFTFFEKTLDALLLSRSQMISSSNVIYNYPTVAAIEVVKYEYPVGQLFYAYSEGTFYVNKEDNILENVVYLAAQSVYSVSTGRQGLFFQYKHISNNTTRVDPATSNIIDLYVVTQSYYTQYQNWLRDTTNTITMPYIPTMSELQQLYGKLDEYKMISDSMVLNSVRFKPLFGNKAEKQLQATVKVIRSTTTTASDSEIRSRVLEAMNTYFSIDNWDFGDTFYFSELSAYLHSQIGDLVNSIVLVPNDPEMQFGDLYEIRSAPYEIFVNAAQATDIVVISALTPKELQITR
jgi:hypothetical protein